MANEYRRLFQGCERNEDGTQHVVGTNACHWIRRNQVLKNKIATYNRSVADIRSEKAQPKQVLFTVGGNILNYTGETSTKKNIDRNSKANHKQYTINKRSEVHGYRYKQFLYPERP